MRRRSQTINFEELEEQHTSMNSGNVSTSINMTKGVKKIKDFEESLKEPMVPDTEKLVKRAKEELPGILKKFMYTISSVLALLLVILGVRGLLIFFFGVLVIVGLQLAIVF